MRRRKEMKHPQHTKACQLAGKKKIALLKWRLFFGCHAKYFRPWARSTARVLPRLRPNVANSRSIQWFSLHQVALWRLHCIHVNRWWWVGQKSPWNTRGLWTGTTANQQHFLKTSGRCLIRRTSWSSHRIINLMSCPHILSRRRDTP